MGIPNFRYGTCSISSSPSPAPHTGTNPTPTGLALTGLALTGLVEEGPGVIACTPQSSRRTLFQIHKLRLGECLKSQPCVTVECIQSHCQNPQRKGSEVAELGQETGVLPKRHPIDRTLDLLHMPQDHRETIANVNGWQPLCLCRQG